MTTSLDKKSTDSWPKYCRSCITNHHTPARTSNPTSRRRSTRCLCSEPTCSQSIRNSKSSKCCSRNKTTSFKASSTSPKPLNQLTIPHSENINPSTKNSTSTAIIILTTGKIIKIIWRSCWDATKLSRILRTRMTFSFIKGTRWKVATFETNPSAPSQTSLKLSRRNLHYHHPSRTSTLRRPRRCPVNWLKENPSHSSFPSWWGCVGRKGKVQA